MDLKAGSKQTILAEIDDPTVKCGVKPCANGAGAVMQDQNSGMVYAICLFHLGPHLLNSVAHGTVQ